MARLLTEEFQSPQYAPFDEGGATEPFGAGFLFLEPSTASLAEPQNAHFVYRHDARCLELRRVNSPHVIDTVFVRRLLPATDASTEHNWVRPDGCH
jgi:hypothetical protein